MEVTAASGWWSARTGNAWKKDLDAGVDRGRGWVFVRRNQRFLVWVWCWPEVMVAAVKEGRPDLTVKEGDPDLTARVPGVGTVFAGDEVDGGPALSVGKLCECLLLLSGGWSTATEPP